MNQKIFDELHREKSERDIVKDLNRLSWSDFLKDKILDFISLIYIVSKVGYLIDQEEKLNELTFMFVKIGRNPGVSNRAGNFKA